MSFRTAAEQELKIKISKALLDRSSGFHRAWLNPSKYDKILSFDILPSKIEEERIIYPAYSYEIFDMEKEELSNFIDDLASKIEIFFFTKLIKATDGSVVSYHEDSIEISLEYRVVLIKIRYSLSF